jgi:glucosyl-dolichyl phosphate glucuronosyltransferase
MTLLSVIIPTRDRPELLRDTLRTVLACEVPDGAIEVIVVDDGSEPELRPVVEEVAGDRTNVRCERQAPGGLNAGRNRGAELAQGPVLAFLDDDVLVSEGWAAAVIDTFRDLGCDGLAGRILLQLEAPEPKWLSPRRRTYLSELDLGDDGRWLDDAQLPYGANCAVTKEMFERAGEFRIGLDREGDSLISNGDTEFFTRVRAAGGRLAYSADAQVLHRVPASRLTDSWALRRAHSQGISDGILLREQEGPARLTVAREVLRLGRAPLVLARDLLNRRGVTGARMFLTYCRGRIGGLSAR